jgi:uncharacterized membrane protein HdeD (DUF308 family)
MQFEAYFVSKIFGSILSVLCLIVGFTSITSDCNKVGGLTVIVGLLMSIVEIPQLCTLFTSCSKFTDNILKTITTFFIKCFVYICVGVAQGFMFIYQHCWWTILLGILTGLCGICYGITAHVQRDKYCEHNNKV